MSAISRVTKGIWGPGKSSKPRNPHSLENLKYLYTILHRNPNVSEANCELLIETLRSIAEIFIWGDQNDSSVFEYFLEQGMLSHFLNYMAQKNGRLICVQILQTLNILFENIRQETSLYYLLSNNLVNRIIVHKFDFTDEEITAYYISFLKILSFKLNSHSINFFYNDRNNDFPLYVEALKFFNHPESMVRIAVRTLTLNIFKVSDPAVHRFILDRTATEYFSNLVWFIRTHILDFDNLIRNNRDINNCGRLTSNLEAYLDNIHYLQDIFLTNVDSLNNVLKEQLMNRLLIPVYIFSLIKRDKFCRVKDPRPILDQSSALFLLAEVIIEELADIILSADVETVEAIQRRYGEQTSYSLPPTTLDICLAKQDMGRPKMNSDASDIQSEKTKTQQELETTKSNSISSSPRLPSANPRNLDTDVKPECLYVSNWTDDEKCRRRNERMRFDDAQLTERPYFEALIRSLDCTESDQQCFYALSVLLTMTMNPSVDSVILESVCLTVKSTDKSFYNTILVGQLCEILRLSTATDSNIRLVTLSLAINLLKILVYNDQEKTSYLSDSHLASIEQAHEQATEDLRRHYRQQEMFLDMFEDEYRQMQLNPIRLEHLLKDPCMLYPATTTPLSGVEFIKRLPSGDIERARRAIRVYFLIRALSLELRSIDDVDLPLTKPETLVKENDKLDLNNSDLIACTVHMKETRDRRFLVTDPMQFILIEPDIRRLGWGIVKFCDLMQDVEVTNDKEDTRSLHITINRPSTNIYAKSNPPILNAKFTFDDHIRCMTAKQNLIKGRQKARQIKQTKIATLLDIPLTNNPINQLNNMSSMSTTYSSYPFGVSTAALSNHPGRATLVSASKRQLINQQIPTTNSSPISGNVEHIRRYSLSRTHSEQTSNSGSGASTPERHERIRRDSVRSNSSATTPKSLRESHEQPVNLSEQPPLAGKVNVQILSPNTDRTSTRFFVDNDLASLVLADGESKSEEKLRNSTESSNKQPEKEDDSSSQS